MVGTFKLFIIATTLIGSLCLKTKYRKHFKAHPITKIKEKTCVYESWDDGEVSWDIEPYSYSYSSCDNSTLVCEKKESSREKIWGLIEELRIQGIISGALSVAYYNTAVRDNIINDFQSFEVKENQNVGSIFVNNLNSELDLVFTLLTIFGYKKYMEGRVPTFARYWDTKYQNQNQNQIQGGSQLTYTNSYIEEYRNARRLSAIIMLCIIIVFCKNVKSAS